MPPDPKPLLFCLLASIIACGAPHPSDHSGGGKGDDAIAPDQETSPACTAPDIVSIERPLPGGGTFTYSVRFRPPAEPDLPTLVFIPGGPGGTSIGSPTDHWLPAELGLVQTDPRGVGCNETEVDDPSAFFTSENFADDIIAMIDHLELDDYILYGHSYGTLLATVTAHELEEAKEVAPPSSVILEGVLGRAWTAEEFAAQSYVDIWNELREELPEDARAILARERPLGLAETDWGAFFMVLMPQGAGAQGNAVLNSLQALSEEAAEASGTDVEENRQALAEQVRALSTAYAESMSESVLLLQRHVACREITNGVPADNIDVVLREGDLVPSPEQGTLCTGLYLDDSFDVSDYLYSSPTYYFLGEHDPATPMWQGEYHFENNVLSPRVLVEVESAGHMPLHQNLATDPEPCALDIVDAIANGSELGAALDTCLRPTTTTSELPE